MCKWILNLIGNTSLIRWRGRSVLSTFLFCKLYPIDPLPPGVGTNFFKRMSSFLKFVIFWAKISKKSHLWKRFNKRYIWKTNRKLRQKQVKHLLGLQLVLARPKAELTLTLKEATNTKATFWGTFFHHNFFILNNLNKVNFCWTVNKLRYQFAFTSFENISNNEKNVFWNWHFLHFCCLFSILDTIA